MDNLKEIVERGWQVGFSHSFEFNALRFYETVGLQIWNEFYIVQIMKIDEEKWWEDEHEVDEAKNSIL